MFVCLLLQTSPNGLFDLILPETEQQDLVTVMAFLYSGDTIVKASRLEPVTSLAITLGISSMVTSISRLVRQQEQGDREQMTLNEVMNKVTTKVPTSSSPTFFARRSPSPPSPPCSPHPPTSRSVSPPTPGTSKRARLSSPPVPLLQSLLSQSLSPVTWPDPLALLGRGGHTNLGVHTNQLASLGQTNQLANLLSAAAKLKQVAEQAMQSPTGGQDSGEAGDRKLAFHEPRPCPVCRRMYRDAATLRTHSAIMHSEGTEPFRCSCGISFGTKYEMYHHKKTGHPPVKS